MDDIKIRVIDSKKLIEAINTGSYDINLSAVMALGAVVTQSASQWIPCSERLPEPGKYYLVTRQTFGWNCTEYREIDIAKYDFDGWHKATKVLAWCELPKPWEGEGERYDRTESQ